MAKDILGQGVYQYGAEDMGMSAALRTSVEQMHQLAKATGVASKVTVNFQKGTLSVATGLNKISSATNRASQSTNEFGKDMFRASIALGGMTAALGALGKSVGNVAFQFNRNMTLVRAVTGATTSDFKKMSKEARQLGKETEFGAAKAAEGLLVLSRMGLSAADSMQVLAPAMKLAQSQQYDMKESTELVIQQLKVFGKGVDEAASFANVLAATSSKSAADLEKLGLSLSYAGPIAASTGRSFEEMNTILGMMFNAGIKASRAGTSLRFAMAALLGTTAKTGKVLNKLHLSLKDVSPTTNSFSKILKTLADSLRGVEDRTSILFDLFGKRAAPAMAAVINQVIRDRNAFDDLQESITGTNETSRQFETQMQSFSGNMLKTRSTVQELSLSFTESFLPAVNMLMTGVQNVIGWLVKLPPIIKNLGVSFTVGSAGALALLGVFTSFSYISGLVAKSLKAVNLAVAAGVTSLKTMKANLTTFIKLEKSFNKVLTTTVARRMEENLIKNKVNKETAKEITSTAMLSASTKKLSAEKLKAVEAELDDAFAKGLISKKQRRLNIQSIEGILLARGYTAAVEGEVVAMNFASIAASKLSMVMKGLWASFGWVGLLSVAIPAIITLFAKMIGDAKKAKEEYLTASKEMLDSYDKLEKKMVAVKDIQDDINKTKDIKDETKRIKTLSVLNEELSGKLKQVEDVKTELIKQYPGILLGYDAEKDALIINNKLLDEEIKKRQTAIDVKTQGNKANKTLLEQQLSTIDAAETPAEKIKLAQGYVKDLTPKMQWESGNNHYQHMMVEQKSWGAAKELKKSDKILEDYTNAMLVLTERIKKYKKAQEEAAKTDVAAKAAMEAAAKAAKAASADQTNLFDEMNLSLGGLRDSIQQVATDISSKMGTLGADEFTKSLGKIDQEYNKFQGKMAKYSAKLKKAMLAVGKAFDNKKITADQKKALHSMSSIIETTITNTTKLGKGLAEEQKTYLEEEYYNKITIMEDEHQQQMAAIGLKGVGQFNLAGKEKIKLLKANQKLALQLEKNHVSKISQAIIKAREGDQYYEGIHVTVLEKQKQESLDKIKAMENVNIEEIRKAKMDAFEAEQAHQRKLYNSEHQNTLDQKKFYIKQIKERVKEFQKAGDKTSDNYKETLAELRVANQDYTMSMVKEWQGMTNAILGAMTELAGYIDKDLAASMKNLERGITGVFNLIEGVASENYVQAIGGILEVILAAVNESVAGNAKSEAAIKKRQQDQLKLNFDLSDSVKNLTGRTDSLNVAFADLVRTAISLKTSEEDRLRKLVENNEEMAQLSSSFAEFDPKNMFMASGQVNVNNILPTMVKLLNGGTSGNYNYDQNNTNWYNKAQSGVTTKERPEYIKDLGYKTSNILADIFNNPTYVALLGKYANRAGFTSLKEAGSIGNDQQPYDTFQQIEDFPKKLQDALEALRISDKSNYYLLRRTLFDFSKLGNKDAFSSWAGTMSDQIKISQIDMGKELFAGVTKLLDNGGATTEKLGEEFAKFRKFYESKAGENVTLSNGTKLPLVSSSDYLEIMKRMFDNTKKQAEDTNNPDLLKQAYSDKADMLDFALRNFKDISTSQQFDLLGQLSEIDQGRADAVGKFINDYLKDYSTDLSSISSEFEKGTITYAEAIKQYEAATKAFGEVPASMAEEFNKIVKSFMQTVRPATTGSQLSTIKSDVGTTTEQYKTDLETINKTYGDIQSNWEGLLKQREDLKTSLAADSQKIKDDSDERIKSMEDERNATLGMFSFSETQNQRSKRFADARKIEKNILDEIVSKNEKLADLEQKNKEAVAAIDKQLEALKEKYGSLNAVVTEWQTKRNDLQVKYLGFLDDESAKIGNLIGRYADLRDAYSSTLSSGGSASEAASEASSVASSATMPVKTQTGVGQTQTSQIAMPIIPPEQIFKSILLSIKSLASKDLGIKAATIQGGLGAGGIGVGFLKDADGNVLKALMSDSASGEMKTLLEKVAEMVGKDENLTAIKAQHGFSGIVKQPTTVTMGEGFRPELLNITPISDIAGMANGIGAGNVTNIYINDSIDLRGAYGITDESVADEVYREVWAPARRRNLDRFINTNGKVIQ